MNGHVKASDVLQLHSSCCVLQDKLMLNKYQGLGVAMPICRVGVSCGGILVYSQALRETCFFPPNVFFLARCKP